MIEFLYPYIFLIFILYFICLRFCKKKLTNIYFSNMPMLLNTTKQKTNMVKILQILILFFMLVSLASPIIKKDIKLHNTNGYDISLIVDASFSMNEFDKFNITKNIVEKFIDNRPTDRVALSIFADFSYNVVPLTYDKNSLQTSLKYIQVGVAGSRDTALYEALYKGIDVFKDSKAKNKIAILLTDGLNTVQSIPLDIAIAKAKKYNIKVYTIGVGQKGDFDKKTLQTIAKQTNAVFYETSDPQKLQQIYNQINKLEKSKITTSSYTQKQYLFQYTLVIAIILFLILIFYTYSNRKNLLFLYLSFIFALFSIYRPTILSNAIDISQENKQILIGFDFSKSMNCQDVYPNRLEFAKNKFIQILDNFKNIKIGLVGFSNQTYLIAPITDDYKSLKFLISNINLSTIEQKDSNIYQILQATNQLLKNEKQKTLILFTDGTNKLDFEKEISYAKKHKIKIYIYAIATLNGGVIHTKNGTLKSKDGNIVITSLNPAIKDLAKNTGGKYIQYSLKNNDFLPIIKDIEKNLLYKTNLNKTVTNSKELYFVPLSISLIFFILYTIGLRRFKK